MNSLDELDVAFQEALAQTTDVPEKMAQWQASLQTFVEQYDLPQEELEAHLAEWRRILQVNKHLLQEHQENLKEKIKIGDIDSRKTEFVKKYKH